MTFTLRRAAAHDIEWLVELRAEVLRADLERLGCFDEHRVRQRMRDAFMPASTRIVVVDGENVGSITLREEPDAVWLEHFYLAPTLQGRGIGSAVLAQTIATHDDAKPLRLNVLVGSPAQRLYERHGFTVDSSDEVDVWITHGTSAA